MQAGNFRKAVLYGLSFTLLSSCSNGASFGQQQSFRSQYTVARDALEAGDYDLAVRSYTRLTEQAGPLEPRIRLEFAHTQLRAGDYASAAKQVRLLTDTQAGVARAAVLSVQATAEHEMGLSALLKGDSAQGKKLLQSADKAMAEVLNQHPEMDPIGALAARRASIKVRLASL